MRGAQLRNQIYSSCPKRNYYSLRLAIDCSKRLRCTIKRLHQPGPRDALNSRIVDRHVVLPKHLEKGVVTQRERRSYWIVHLICAREEVIFEELFHLLWIRQLERTLSLILPPLIENSPCVLLRAAYLPQLPWKCLRHLDDMYPPYDRLAIAIAVARGL